MQMSAKTSITEILENSWKYRGSDITNKRRYDTDRRLLMPSSDTGENKIVFASILVFHALVALGILSKYLRRQLVCVFHPGRQGARDTIIPLLCYKEPLAAVPAVLGIIKQPRELLSGIKTHPFVLRLCNT